MQTKSALLPADSRPHASTGLIPQGQGVASLAFRLSILLLVSGSMMTSVVACDGGGGGGSTTPPPTTYTIGGTVSGLTGMGLVLQNNGGNNLTITGNGSFTFSAAINSGSVYDVTVLTQPSGPVQTCNVTGGTGTATANVTSVQVACTTAPTYTIGGTVAGLSGTGLLLQNNGGDNLSVTANGSFTFSTSIASGGAYDVTVLTQPSSPAQTCAVTDSSGTASANVTSVQVACTTTIIPTYTIGGTVSGLLGTGLALQNNGDDNLSVTANGDFTFSTEVASGSAYNVTVLTQPSSPAQTCAVTDGSGTASADVTSVQVACANQTASEWTWEGGADTDNQPGTYGTLGTAAPANVPGAREGPVSWTDAAGNLWVFGGYYDDQATGTLEYFNDLWKYSAGEWTWMSGSNTVNQAGTYGTLGTAAPGNIPGGREYAVSWTDASGNFWLFGGQGYDSKGNLDILNDLWKYSAGEWTWMGGSDVSGQGGTYGTLGTADPGNVPGARSSAVGWTDAAGDLWLFGGVSIGQLNDLWKYSAGEWTWMGGSNTTNQPGTYGTLGTAAPANIPQARHSAASWTDTAGNFWLFGGVTYDAPGGGTGFLNDLWKYSAGEWTWMGGSDGDNQAGTYGTLGVAAPNNVPGARLSAVSWTDAAGNFWLFGGDGYDYAGGNAFGWLNDLWKYSAGEWTWMGGSNNILDVSSTVGTYGTLGIAAPINVPGVREGAVGWTDAAGNLWLFGGEGYASTQSGGQSYLNDLWEYVP